MLGGGGHRKGEREREKEGRKEREKETARPRTLGLCSNVRLERAASAQFPSRRNAQGHV